MYGAPSGIFAGLPFFAGVNIDENAHEVVDGGRDANEDEKIGHGGGSFPGRRCASPVPLVVGVRGVQSDILSVSIFFTKFSMVNVPRSGLSNSAWR